MRDASCSLVAPTPYAGAPQWQSLGDLRLRVVSLSRCRTRRSLGTVPPHTPNSSRDVRPARGTQRWTGQVRQRARPASMAGYRLPWRGGIIGLGQADGEALCLIW